MSAPATSYAATVLGDRPQLYYRLADSGCCVALDSSGNGLHGSYSATSVTWGAAGLLTGDTNAAIANNGTGAAVIRDPSGLPTTGARTVELWEQTTNTNHQTLFSYGDYNVNGAYFMLTIRPDARGTLLQFIGANDDAAFYTPSTIDDGLPHHIALSYDGSAFVTFYVDGQQIGRAGLTLPLNTALNVNPLAIGSGLDFAFNGVFDEFAIYPAALTPDQVNGHWRAGTAAPACPAAPTSGYAGSVMADQPYRYFRLDDVGQAATDSSGNCRFAAYASATPRVAGLLTADSDGAIGTPTPARSVLSASMDGTPASGARTVEIWEQTTNNNWQTLLSYGSLAATGGFFQVSIRPDVHGTVVLFGGWNDDLGFYTPTAIDDGLPHQIAVTYDGAAVITFYVDGQQFGQGTLGTPLNTDLGGQPLVLSAGLDGPFNGVLDELSFYPAALSASRINAHYMAGALPPGYSLLEGTALAAGTGLAGAHAEACPTTGGACFTGPPTGATGAFRVTVPTGSYSLTVFPPAGSQYLTPKMAGPFTVPPAITDITVVFSSPVPNNGTFSSPGGGTVSNAVPNLNWAQPSTYTITGCAGGFGDLQVQAFNRATGKPQSLVFPFVETPRGSGTYVAHLPALAPLHGLASVSQAIMCPGHTSVLPDGGRPGGGTTVILLSSGLTGATQVRFGGTPATSFQVLNDNAIKAVSPAGTGSVDVSVTTASGGSVVIGTYTYIEVTGLSPNTGPSPGGTTVTITGQGFTDVRGVIFGLLPATSFSVISATQITAVAPAGLGIIDVQVINGFGVTDAVTASLYTYTDGPPGSLSINEGTGPTAIDLLSGEVLGAGFCDASYQAQNTVHINFGKMCTGADRILEEAGPTGVLKGQAYAAAIVLPALALIVLGFDAVVLGGILLAASPYILAALALLAAFTIAWDLLVDPAGTVTDTAGNPISGATATIQGQGIDGSFAAVPAGSGLILPAINPETTDATGAFEWDAASGIYLISATKTGCHAPGDAGHPGVSTPSFTLPPPVVGLILTMECPGSTAPVPTVTALFPALGISGGGTQVEISGTGLADNPSVRFGSTPAQSVTVLSPYAIVAIAPPGTSPVDVTVTTAGGTSAVSSNSTFGYFTPPSGAGAPSITSVSPTSGPTAGGNLVKIFGTGLSGVFAVTFGNFAAVLITNVSATEVDAVAPSGAGDGPVSILVSTSNGSSAPAQAARYTYGSPVNRATTTSLSSSANPSVYRTAVTLTATIAPSRAGTPTGVVTFGDSAGGGTTLGTGAVSTSGGVSTATLTTSLLAVGTHAITASYGGDSGFDPSSGTLSQTVNPGPLDHLVLSPASAAITAGAHQSYTAEGFDQYSNDLGDLTSSTTFTLSPDGSCSLASCTATAAGAHTVTGSDGGKTGSAGLTVNPAGLDHLVLSPASATIIAGGSQTYAAEGFDLYNNDLGNMTSATTFTIAPNGICTVASCTATVAGPHTVTGNDGGKTGTASLNVTSVVDLRLSVSISPATAKTGTVVTGNVSLTNTASVSRTVTVNATFNYVSPTGKTSTMSSNNFTISLAAGQTVTRSFTFKITKDFARGTYTFAVTASDVTGSVTSAATFKVT